MDAKKRNKAKLLTVITTGTNSFIYQTAAKRNTILLLGCIELDDTKLKATDTQSLNFRNTGEKKALTRSVALTVVPGIANGKITGNHRKAITLCRSTKVAPTQWTTWFHVVGLVTHLKQTEFFTKNGFHLKIVCYNNQ